MQFGTIITRTIAEITSYSRKWLLVNTFISNILIGAYIYSKLVAHEAHLNIITCVIH